MSTNFFLDEARTIPVGYNWPSLTLCVTQKVGSTWVIRAFQKDRINLTVNSTLKMLPPYLYIIRDPFERLVSGFIQICHMAAQSSAFSERFLTSFTYTKLPTLEEQIDAFVREVVLPINMHDRHLVTSCYALPELYPEYCYILRLEHLQQDFTSIIDISHTPWHEFPATPVNKTNVDLKERVRKLLMPYKTFIEQEFYKEDFQLYQLVSQWHKENKNKTGAPTYQEMIDKGFVKPYVSAIPASKQPSHWVPTEQHYKVFPLLKFDK